MGLCLRVVRVPPYFCFPVNRVWMESYGYYLAKKQMYVCLSHSWWVLIIVFSILMNKAKRMDEIYSRWRTRLRSYVPDKIAAVCLSIDFFSCRHKDFEYAPCKFTSYISRVNPQSLLTTIPHSNLLLSFIILALDRSKDDLKVLVKFCRPISTQSRTLSSPLLSLTNWTKHSLLRKEESPWYLNHHHLIYALMVSEDGKDLSAGIQVGSPVIASAPSKSCWFNWCSLSHTWIQ